MLEYDMKEIDAQLDFIEGRNNFPEYCFDQELPSKEELIRYYKLCDEQNFDYNDIKKFEYWLNTPTSEQWIHYFEMSSKYDEMLRTPELDELNMNYSNKEKEYSVAKERAEKVCTKEEMFKYAIEKAKNNNDIRLTNKTNEKNIIMDNEIRLYCEVMKLRKQISNLRKLQESKMLDNNKEFTQLKNEFDYYMDHLIEGEIVLNQIEFNNFRNEHFNDNAERLLRELGIKGISKMLKDEIVQQGSEEDYRRFIEDKILSMDDLYFENYREYYKNTFLKNNSH